MFYNITFYPFALQLNLLFLLEHNYFRLFRSHLALLISYSNYLYYHQY